MNSALHRLIPLPIGLLAPSINVHLPPLFLDYPYTFCIEVPKCLYNVNITSTFT